MKLSTKVFIGAVCLTTAGILIFALKKKNPATVTAGSQRSQILDDFIKNHNKNGDGYMLGAIKAALDFSRRQGLNPPRQDNVILLHFVVQNGMNPADLVNKYESTVM